MIEILAKVKQAIVKKYENTAFFNDWEQVKGRVIYQVESTGKEDLCEGLLKVPFLDFNITFSVVINIQMPAAEEKLKTFPVTRSMYERWGVDTDVLMKQAQSNNEVYRKKVLYEFWMGQKCVYDIDRVPDDIKITQELEKGLMVVTNERECYGASVLADTEWLSKVAALIGTDLYILPVSVHQVVLQSADGKLNVGDLKDMLMRMFEVAGLDADEYLSSSVYYFGQKQKKLYKVA